MKFLTVDVYNSWYNTYQDDSALKSAFQQYHQYLKSIEDILPVPILMLAQLRGVDDGLVCKVTHDRIQQVLTITLRCGHLQMGYYDLILRYEEADISSEDEQTLIQIARTTKDESKHKFDLYFHEVDITQDGRIEHRLLFHPGTWLAIRCRVLNWKKVDRPDQKLPRLRERFTEIAANLL